jgi:hypothetical protein
MSTATAPLRGNPEPAPARHGERAVVEIDARLFGSLDVVRPGFVTGPQVDDGVVAIRCDEPDRAGGDLHDRGDRVRRFKGGHRFSLVEIVGWFSGPSR